MNKKFKKGDIVYKISSLEDGGLTIDRFEVNSIGEIESEILTIDEQTGEEVKKIVKKQIITVSKPIINSSSDKKIKKNEFEFTDDFYSRDEIKNNFIKYLDQISYF